MLQQQTKKKKITELQILSLCFRLYLKNVKNCVLLFILLIFAIIAKYITVFYAKQYEYRLNHTNDILGDCKLLFVFKLTYSFLSAMSSYIILCCGILFQTNVAKKAFANILKHESANPIDLSSGKTQYAISEGSAAMSKLFEHCILEFLQKMGYFVGDLIICYHISDLHLFLSFLLIIVAFYIHIRGALVAMKCKNDINKVRGSCDKVIYEDISNYEIIKSYQTENKHIESYGNRMKAFKAASIRHAKTVVSLSLIDDLFFNITAFALLIILYLQGNHSNYKYRNCYTTILSLEKTMENISNIFRKYKEALVTSKLVLYYLEEIDGFAPGTSIKNTFDDKIIFENVGYSVANVKIFQNINFTINKNEKVCIYGRNGTGKSTISKIIMRLYFIDSGKVTIDGMDIYDILISNYRKLITYVPQDTSLFDETVFYNLTYGNNQPLTNVIQECKKFDIHEDILKLENGYNTYLGERGSTINGGLRQKIFYVRALLTKAPIYIFDEPTNNLDEQSTQNVIELILGESFADKTVIVICHDYESVKKFPSVLKFVDGKIIKEIN
ncbi:ATM1-type heavy metal exporter [Vairimorpha necatrix]|uniref:ATM1-type heavy metal exporter n=1 Tax=Vairimorpha necatrix TaxID=6039 RepID=A0AAX4J8Q0_9MICR